MVNTKHPDKVTLVTVTLDESAFDDLSSYLDEDDRVVSYVHSDYEIQVED